MGLLKPMWLSEGWSMFWKSELGCSWSLPKGHRCQIIQWCLASRSTSNTCSAFTVFFPLALFCLSVLLCWNAGQHGHFQAALQYEWCFSSRDLPRYGFSSQCVVDGDPGVCSMGSAELLSWPGAGLCFRVDWSTLQVTLHMLTRSPLT